MKKITVLFLITIILMTFSITTFANENAIVMAVNEEIMVVNGNQIKVAAPILVLDKTYVDLYAVAPHLNINLEWVEADGGYVRASAKGKTYEYKCIRIWEELINETHKCFIKDSTIFVSLRELNDMAGYNLTYNDGLITVGKQADVNQEIYGDISAYESDEFVYTKYPVTPEYVVYPYQKYSYETMLEDVKKLQRMYPELIKTSSIGKSVEGRDLLLIEFGKGDEKVFVCGTHHGREYISTTYLMYAIDRYSYAYRYGSMWGEYNPKEILENITFCIVPMVNPDGVNLVINGINATKNPAEVASMGIYESPQYGYLAWKANINGVDLNWNYDKDWSIEKNRNPRGSAGFTGDRPATEPETIAVSNYVDNNLFEAFVSFHTQGEIFYWADNKEKPSGINEKIRKDTGFVEYKDEGTGIGGSFFDYAYRKFNKPTLTVELCEYIGNYPYPDEDFDAVWKPAKNVLLIVGSEIANEK